MSRIFMKTKYTQSFQAKLQKWRPSGFLVSFGFKLKLPDWRPNGFQSYLCFKIKLQKKCPEMDMASIFKE